MRILDKLEKRFGHLAVPNIVLTLIGAQLLVYGLLVAGQIQFGTLPLIPKAVFAGEVWRIFSFLISPPYVAQGAFGALFLAFFWYIFWMMSSALETQWGVFRFNVFLLLGVIFTVVSAFLGQLLSPGETIMVSPNFLYLSVFFAFAMLHPDFEFMLFLVLPVKVKWLGWLAAVLTFFAFVTAPAWGARLAILGPVLNFLLFFRGELTQAVRQGRRRAQLADAARKQEAEPFHTCVRCGATDLSHPDLGFRYKRIDGDLACICDSCREKPDPYGDLQ